MKNQKIQSFLLTAILRYYHKLSFCNYIFVLNFISVITVDGKNCKAIILVANGFRFLENTLLQFNHQKLSLEKKINIKIKKKININFDFDNDVHFINYQIHLWQSKSFCNFSPE